MRKSWLEMQTDEEVWNKAHQFATESRNAIHNGTGKFWADTIKKYHDAPDKRLTIALDNLPLPGAFRDAKIALRATIRSKRKSKQDYADELELIYRLAVIESFSIPYSKRLKMPGYNVIEHTPGGKLNSLPFNYQNTGYYKLDLTKTDIKWIVEQWGEPKRHSTLHKDYHDLWVEQEDKFSSNFDRKLKELSGLAGFAK